MKFKLNKTVPKPVFFIEDRVNLDQSIVMNIGSDEMLRVARDGFYVQGKKLRTDDKEAEQVYNAFKQWLEWSMLNREY